MASVQSPDGKAGGIDFSHGKTLSGSFRWRYAVGGNLWTVCADMLQNSKGDKKEIKKEKIEESEQVKEALREEIEKILEKCDNSLKLETKPSVILVVGVNGVGKTTSIGKMAARLARDGKKVIVAAADTFRAAAVEH